jgi:hypothetical protein
MPITLNCAECDKPLKVPDEWAGKRGRCPKCSAIIQIPGTVRPMPRADEDEDEPRSSRPAPQALRRAPSREEDESAPARPAARFGRRSAEDDEDESPRAGAALRRRSAADDDEDEDDRRSRRRRRPAAGGNGLILALVLGLGGLLLLGVIGGVIGLVVFLRSSKTTSSASSASSSSKDDSKSDKTDKKDKTDAPNPSGLPTGWTQVTWTEGKCRFSMPGTPTDKTRGAGGGTLHTKELDQGEKGYFVGYIDLPPDPPPDAKLKEEALNLFRDGMSRSPNITGLQSEKRITIGEHPGRELLYNMKVGGQTGKMKIRLYVVGNRMYQVAAAGTGTIAESPESQRFLDSFELTK